MSNTLYSILVMTGLGISFALLLSIAYKFFKIEEDPKVKKIEEVLPGLNCGACGVASCHAFAKRIAENQDFSATCVPGGEEVANKIANIMGRDRLRRIVPLKAVVHCGGSNDKAKIIADYQGIETCQAAQLVKGGFLGCDYGCFGLGDCARVCPENCIQMVNGLAVIDINRCTGCGECVKACPRDIISLEQVHNDELIKVACNSPEDAKEVKKVCQVGCIACKICEKKGPDEVFKVKNNLSQVDYKKAKQYRRWDEVIEACPTNCIKLEKIKKQQVGENKSTRLNVS